MEWSDRIEPDAVGLVCIGHNWADKATISIAVSLKRIADALDAQGMSAGTAKTPEAVEGEARQPGPQGCAHNQEANPHG